MFEHSIDPITQAMYRIKYPELASQLELFNSALAGACSRLCDSSRGLPNFEMLVVCTGYEPDNTGNIVLRCLRYAGVKFEVPGIPGHTFLVIPGTNQLAHMTTLMKKEELYKPLSAESAFELFGPITGAGSQTDNLLEALSAIK